MDCVVISLEIPTLVFEDLLHIYIIYTLYRTRLFLPYWNSEESLVVFVPTCISTLVCCSSMYVNDQFTHLSLLFAS